MKKVIFDQDNTLITWGDDNYDTLDETFKELKIEITKEEKQKIIESIDNYENIYSKYDKTDMYNLINKNLNKKLPNNWIDTWLKYLGKRNVKLEPNTLEILKYLHQKYKIIVLTNWFTISQIECLKNAGLIEFIDEVIGTDQVLNKPNKEAFIKALGDFKKEETIVIGDNFKTDIMGSMKAGIEAIWYNPKQKQSQEKIKVRQITNLIELKKYL